MITLSIQANLNLPVRNAIFLKKIGLQINSGSEIQPQNHLILNIDHFGVTRKAKVLTSTSDFDTHEVNAVDGLLYFTSCAPHLLEKFKVAMERNLALRIYFVCHSFFDVKTEFLRLKSMAIDVSRISFVCSADYHTNFLHKTNFLKDYIFDFRTGEIIFSKLQIPEKKRNQSKTDFLGSFLLFKLLRFILAPALVLKIHFQDFRSANNVWLLRLIELIQFFKYIFKQTGISIYYPTLQHGRFLRHTLVQLSFRVRHIGIGAFLRVYYTCDHFIRISRLNVYHQYLLLKGVFENIF